MSDPVRIIWKKWHDPLLAAVKEHREVGWHDGYEYLDKPGQAGAYTGPCLYSAAGIIPLNELNTPSRNFNLWVGHASFDIDKETRKRILEVPGVEMFRVWTRYRFWLGIGACFEENEVKAAVQAAALPPKKPVAVDPKHFDAVRALSKNLTAKHKFWAIFVLPTGKCDFVYGEERATVEQVVDARRDKVKRVVTSWEKETDVA